MATNTLKKSNAAYYDWLSQSIYEEQYGGAPFTPVPVTTPAPSAGPTPAGNQTIYDEYNPTPQPQTNTNPGYTDPNKNSIIAPVPVAAPAQTGIVYDAGTDTWVDRATGKIVGYGPNNSATPITKPPALTPDTSIQDNINALKKAQLASRISALDTARNNSLSGLDTGLNTSLSNLQSEQAGIAPAAYGARNQVQSSSDIGALNFAQYMASRGVKGNAGAMPEIYRNNALQSGIGKINQQELAANTDIARRTSDTKNLYETTV